MPKMNRIPFKKGDILRWKTVGQPTPSHLDAVMGYINQYGRSPMVMMGRDAEYWQQIIGPEDKDRPIKVEIVDAGVTISARWPGYFELDPFLTAVKKRRYA